MHIKKKTKVLYSLSKIAIFYFSLTFFVTDQSGANVRVWKLGCPYHNLLKKSLNKLLNFNTLGLVFKKIILTL